MQRYDFYLILPNFYTLFCYPEITFYTVDAHTGRKLTIPNTIERYLTNLKVHLSGFQSIFRCLLSLLPMRLKLRPDVATATWRRTKDCVAMQQRLRRDAILKVKG